MFTKNGLKQGDALSPLLFNFALQYVISRVQGDQVGLKLNGMHQLLVYANNVNILGRSIRAMKVVASKEIGQEVNAGKTKYMFTSQVQKGG